MEGIINQLIEFGQVIVAVILGGLVGYERETKKKPAGLRTYMFVAGAACAIVSVGNHILMTFPETNNMMADPIRIIQAIIIGIGFIGGGVVKSEGGEVKNLTTAASILLVAIIGITVGLENYLLAVLLTFLSIVISASLLEVEAWIHRDR